MVIKDVQGTKKIFRKTQKGELAHKRSKRSNNRYKSKTKTQEETMKTIEEHSRFV